MSDVAYVTAVVLAGLFAWAGVAKLLDREQTARAFTALGLPAPGLLSTAVPLVELALAVCLLAFPAPAALAALGLLAAFTTILVRAVRAGVDVGCRCFGSARTEPVSSVEVLRNGLLGGAATVASFATGPVVPQPSAVLLVGAAALAGAAAVAHADRRRRASQVSGVE